MKFFRRFRRHPLAAAALALLVLLTAAAALAGVVADQIVGQPLRTVDLDPARKDLSPSLGARTLDTLEGPRRAWHPLGTNKLGQDLLVRILYGGRVSLAAGFAAAVLALFLGCLAGGLAGTFGGRFDAALMRLTDFMMALPLLPVLIILSAADLQKMPGGSLIAAHVPPEYLSVVRIVVLESLLAWMGTARIVRGQILTLRERDFVLSARALGSRRFRLLWRHLLPNCAGPVLVAGTLAVGEVILAESALSFLGLGVQAPLPSWGNLLMSARPHLATTPWLAIFPGLCILLTVASFNFLGDGLRDAVDPRTREDSR